MVKSLMRSRVQLCAVCWLLPLWVAISLSVTSVAIAVDTDGDGLLDLMDVPGFDPNASGVANFWGRGIEDLDGVNQLNSRFLHRIDLGGNEFTSNGITSIESGDFAGMDNLEELYLYNNGITSIESGDFAGLTNLEYLTLAGNGITSIENGDFAGLANLQSLGLHNNAVTKIESGAFGDFAGMNNLKILSLPHNGITSIESGAFPGLTNLQYLGLDDNDFSELNLAGATFERLGYDFPLFIYPRDDDNGIIRFPIDSDEVTSLVLDNATLSSVSFETIVAATTHITDASLVGLTFESVSLPTEPVNIFDPDAILAEERFAVPTNLNALLEIGSLDTVAIDQALFDSYADELNTFATTEGNTLTVIGYGDSNLDGEFNSSDLVTVFAAGEYEDGIAENSYWTEGDWNSDGDFDSSDLVIAFRDGRYEQGPRVPVNAVPEPTAAVLFLIGILALRGKRQAI